VWWHARLTHVCTLRFTLLLQWVPGKACNGLVFPACKNHSKYDSAKSSTYRNCTNAGGCKLVLPYGSGVVFGNIVEDSTTIGGLTVTGQLFGEVTVEPGEIWVVSPFDGILGESLSHGRVPTPIAR
jgi:hypothetical protein